MESVTMQLLILISIPLLIAAENATEPANATEPVNATEVLNDITAPSLSIGVSKRQPDYITLTWNVTDSHLIASYLIKVKGEDDYSITYEGKPYVDHTKREATVMVHEADTNYDICVIAELTDDAKEKLSRSKVEECVETSTIKIMLASSIVALVLTILFFVLCILIGYIAWKCAAKKHESKEEYDKSDLTGNGDIVPLTHIED